MPEDYPTILAGVDAAVAGDSVLVGPGRWTDSDTRLWPPPSYWYEVTSCAFLRQGITLLSEAGPESTIIDFAEASAGGRYRAAVFGWIIEDEGPTVDGFTITGVADTADQGACFRRCALVTVRNCLFWDLAGRGIYSLDTPLAVEGCRFIDCRACGIFADNHDLTVDACYFEDCQGSAILGSGYQGYPRSAEIRNSIFLNNTTSGSGAAIRIYDFMPTLIEDCRFDGNIVQYGGGAVSASNQGAVHIRGNVFVRNHCETRRAGALNCGRAFVDQNTFVANSVGSADEAASAVYNWSDGAVQLHQNVFVGNYGAAAIAADDEGMVTTSCNIFWNNPDGELAGFALSADDLFVDPQFCAPDIGDYRVSADSPCLPENSLGLCGAIGALGEGCPDRGGVSSLVTASSLRALVIAEDKEQLPPALVHWLPGSQHEIGLNTPQSPTPETQYLFAAWSDGGDTVHAVTAPAMTETYTASFDSLFYLTMEAGEGGTSHPASDRYPGLAEVEIIAVADSGYRFSHWDARGMGCYGGTDSVAVVIMYAPIWETALFTKDEDVRITTDPAGLEVIVDGAAYVSPVDFIWERGTTHTIEVDSLQVVGEGSRERFIAWSDGGSRAHLIEVPHSPLVVTARFAREYLFQNLVGTVGGVVVPESGWYPAEATLEIAATPYPYYIFTDWEGSGDGSYTGPDNPAVVTMNSPVAEIANFFRIAHEISLSLSETDPMVLTGPPLDHGWVHLWVICSTAGGIMRFEADVTGTMEVLVFNAATGLVNAGDATHLKLVSPSCVVGPRLLGSFFVHDPSGGELCLTPSQESGILGVHDCSSPALLLYEYPRDIKIRCVRTDGGTPWIAGRGCDEEDDPVGVPVSGFAASVEGRTVVLAWDTGSQEPFDGFHVYRSHAPAVGYRLLTEELVRGQSPYRWVDATVGPGVHYFYRLGAVDLAGGEVFYGPVSVTTPAWRPWENGLELARPNPSFGLTELTFTLARPARVSLSIYDVAGRLVRRLVEEERGAGEHPAVWDSRDAQGRVVPAGVYFSRLVAGDFVQSRKLVQLGSR